jgi:PAS domain S-box-containing protein
MPMRMIENSHIAAVISDPRLPDNPIIACNAAFEALTEYQRGDILGRNCRFLRGPETDDKQCAVLRDSIFRREPVLVELLNYRKDGSKFRNAVMVAPIFGADGMLEYFIGSQIEVADEKAYINDARKSEAMDAIAALSRRQQEILRLMACGRLNKQIAHELSLSERTVKMHRAAMLERLGIRTNAEAIRIAIEAGY